MLCVVVYIGHLLVSCVCIGLHLYVLTYITIIHLTITSQVLAVCLYVIFRKVL